MAREKPPAGFTTRKILFILVLLVSAFLCLTGALIALVICADHVAEFFNGWNYENNWEPFHGGYLDYVLQIPGALYVAFSHFPEACFLTMIMYPMLVVAIAIYEVIHNDFTLVLMGWGPFMAGVALFIFGGFNLAQGKDNPDAGKYTKI